MTNAVVERLRQKVTYFYEGDIDEREGEERDKGRRKREDKDERGRGKRKEERGKRNLSVCFVSSDFFYRKMMVQDGGKVR